MNNEGTDQPVHPHSLIRYLLSGKQYRSTFYTQNFNILVSLCRWADIGLILQSLQTQYSSNESHI